MIAAQDGVTMTRAYQKRVLKMSGNPMCRKCHKRLETIGHILSHCESYFWTLYKERHDQVLRVLHVHLCRKLGLRAPEPWEPVPAVQENSKARMLWDVCHPTDREVEDRRPDLTLVLKEQNTVLLLEMACAYDSILEEREDEKLAKYDDLAADLGLQFHGYRVKRVPLVIGDLGSIG